MATLRQQIATAALTLTKFRDLMKRMQESRPHDDLAIVKKAYDYSLKHHEGQMRASGEPYLVHPLEVALVLAEMKMDPVAVAAGLLHDSVEDTSVTIVDIRKEFGEQVAHIVEGVTKISKIEFATREEQQAENIRKMMLAMVDDILVVLIKLADRLHNMRTLEHLDPERQHKIAEETLEIYAPIAHRLGMGKIRGELEDLGFRFLDAVGYAQVEKAVNARRKRGEPSLEKIHKISGDKLTEAGLQRLEWLRQVVEGQRDVSDPNEFLSTLKVDLYPEEVYTFTPKGKVVVLPRDSTPIDFAYTIHTEVGHTCVGAKVNGRMVPLRHKLHSGDIVEILTQPGHKPSRDWLGLVRSSRSRNKIKHWLNVHYRERCCNPIRGESIVGYITRGKGVAVHSANCSNVTNLLYEPERKIDVEWARDDSTPTAYPVKLTVFCDDRFGMLKSITGVIGDAKSNIRNIAAHTANSQASVEVVLDISDLKHLENIIAGLRKIPGVHEVQRLQKI